MTISKQLSSKSIQEDSSQQSIEDIESNIEINTNLTKQQSKEKENLINEKIQMVLDKIKKNDKQIFKIVKNANRENLENLNQQPKDNKYQEQILNYNRREKSLEELSKRFLALFIDKDESLLSLDKITAQLGVERRRIYDIINILESLKLVTRKGKNNYKWNGFKRIFISIHEYMENPQIQQTGPNNNNENISFSQNSLNSQSQKREKSLEMLSIGFLKLFLHWKRTMTLEEAARKLSSNDIDDHKIKTKIRRLYDIANVFKSLGLIKKTLLNDTKKPAFEWVGESGLAYFDQSQNQINNKSNTIFEKKIGSIPPFNLGFEQLFKQFMDQQRKQSQIGSPENSFQNQFLQQQQQIQQQRKRDEEFNKFQQMFQFNIQKDFPTLNRTTSAPTTAKMNYENNNANQQYQQQQIQQNEPNFIDNSLLSCFGNLSNQNFSDDNNNNENKSNNLLKNLNQLLMLNQQSELLKFLSSNNDSSNQNMTQQILQQFQQQQQQQQKIDISELDYQFKKAQMNRMANQQLKSLENLMVDGLMMRMMTNLLQNSNQQSDQNSNSSTLFNSNQNFSGENFFSITQKFLEQKQKSQLQDENLQQQQQQIKQSCQQTFNFNQILNQIQNSNFNKLNLNIPYSISENQNKQQKQQQDSQIKEDSIQTYILGKSLQKEQKSNQGEQSNVSTAKKSTQQQQVDKNFITPVIKKTLTIIKPSLDSTEEREDQIQTPNSNKNSQSSPTANTVVRNQLNFGKIQEGEFSQKCINKNINLSFQKILKDVSNIPINCNSNNSAQMSTFDKNEGGINYQKSFSSNQQTLKRKGHEINFNQTSFKKIKKNLSQFDQQQQHE